MKSLKIKPAPVEVWWEDSHGAGGWHSGDQDILETLNFPMTVRSLGYLIYERKDRIGMAMSLHGDNRMHLLVIPRSQVRRIVKFKLK